MADYMDLNEDSREEQLRHAEVLKKFEAHKRARSVSVPTAIPEIKLQLRYLGHPITLFGEDHADRRERLRQVIARMELDQEEVDKLQAFMNQGPPQSVEQEGNMDVENKAGGPTIVTQDQSKKETVYSPASESLIAARKEIAEFSFLRAQQRLDRERERRESLPADQAQRRSVYELYTNSKEMALNSSQVGDDRPVTVTKYSADGMLLASGSLSGCVKVWASDSLSNRAVLRGTLDRIMSISWHPMSHHTDGGGPMLLAAASAEGIVHVYDYSKYDSASASAATTASASEFVDQMVIVDDNDHGDEDQDEKDRAAGAIKDSNDNGAVVATAVSTGSSSSGSSGGGGSTALLHKLTAHRGSVTDCAFHPSGQYLGTAGADGTWRLWDVEYNQQTLSNLTATTACSSSSSSNVSFGKELLIQDGHAKECSSINFHPDGSLALTADSGGVALLWDLRSGQMIQAFQGHIKKISAISFSAHGFHVATASLDNSVKIWDLRRRKCAYTLPVHTNIVSDCTYSKSGELLLTSSFDGTLKIFNGRNFQILRTLTGHSRRVMSCDFAPDEKHIVSGGFDRTVKLWAHKDEF